MNKLLNLLKQTVKKLYWYEWDFIIYDAKKWQWHYALKETMKLAWMQKKSWMDISQDIFDEIKDSDLIEKCEIFKPWFLNIWLSDKILIEWIRNERTPAFITKNKNKKILIEYWNENIAKQMSVGHLRSNIIWKSLKNIYEKLNYQVETINHLWDYWTQFWKLIVAYKKWWNDEEIEKNPIEELNRIYVKFHEEEKKDPDLENQWREEFKKLENWDKENHRIWQKFVDFSLTEFQKIYDVLGSEFDYMKWESFYIPFLPKIIEELNNSEISEIWEWWAGIVPFWEKKAPLMYLKSNGSTTYATRDLAAIKWRAENIKPDKVFYCVWKEQSQHFQQVFEVAEKMWYNKWAELIHVKNWLYKLANWEKFSTRKWNVIRLSELLETARIKARELLETKDSFKNFETEKEKTELVESLAIWAIKFTDLSQDRETDITFNWDKAITFEWMSGPYMQYAHARTCGILRKAELVIPVKAGIWNCIELKKARKTHAQIPDIFFQKIPEWQAIFTHQKERDLAFFLSKYWEELKKAWKTAKPHIIARYIYTLSQEFNSFYDKCSVLNAETEESKKLRLFLVKKTQETIWEWLRLLWVDDLERM